MIRAENQAFDVLGIPILSVFPISEIELKSRGGGMWKMAISPNRKQEENGYFG